MRKPNLFIVGEPKCGTTTLHYLLGQHPDIFMSTPKELGFFLKKNKMMKKNYLSHFKDAKNMKYAGESSPTYMHDLTTAKRIHDFDPKARIIMIFRNPVDYMLSYHKQLIRNPDCEISIDIRKAMHQMKPAMDFYSHTKQFFDIFPQDQIKIISYEEFYADPLKGYKKLMKWLGVDERFKPKIKVLNKSAKDVTKYRVYNFLRRFFPFLDKIFGIKTVHSEEYWKEARK